ncbi:MAG: hypothetical protein ABSB74_07780 [Tepidisphaeraceae bacterium]
MSRADKQLRRKRRKERKYSRASWSDRTISHLDVDVPPAFRFLEYDITSEPVCLPDESDPQLDAVMEDRREKLFDWTHNHPHRAIPELENLLERFPNSKLLMNWLTAAYQQVDEDEKAERLVKICHERYPDYLFAKVNLAALHLRRGEIAQAEAVMQNKWDLKLMYPDRDVFHVSEFVAMARVAVDYYMLKGNFEAAEPIYEAMTEIAPDHEITQAMKKCMEASMLEQLLRRLAGRASRRRKLPV